MSKNSSVTEGPRFAKPITPQSLFSRIAQIVEHPRPFVRCDTYFGPELSRRMHAAYTGAGGSAEYHLMPPFGNEGHWFIGSPESIPIWSPLVSKFLEAQK